MKEYLKAQSKTNEIIVGNSISSDELDRFSKSDFRWADNRKKAFRQRSVKKGEIYQFEFGKNYIPEMSYEHRGLVIGVKQKLCSVVEIFDLQTLDKRRIALFKSGGCVIKLVKEVLSAPCNNKII